MTGSPPPLRGAVVEPYIPVMPRVIALQGVDNLRDFGGYATACGRGLKPGRLYRSGHHSRATDEDLQAMAGLGLGLIVDLRRANEREREPSRRWPGFSAEVIESDLDDSDGGWESMLRDAEPTPVFFRQKSAEWYRKAPFEPRMIDLFSRYLFALAETGGPVLAHCAAGKDRTGLIVALTHFLAGVHRDDMLEDYLLTNRLDFQAVRLPQVARMIERLSGRAPSDEAVRTAMGVHAEDLEASLDAMVERCGSVDAYVEGPLGFDRNRRAALEAYLLGD